MSPAHVLDKYYLGITALVTVGWQIAGFAIAWTLQVSAPCSLRLPYPPPFPAALTQNFQFDKITDFTGGSNFFALALMTLLLGNTYDARSVVASALVMLWAARIAGFLLLRVLIMGSDSRFDEIRGRFFSFLGFWVSQIVWVWTVSLPLTILNSPAVAAAGRVAPAFGTGRDIVGVVLFGVGWTIETVADLQKLRHKTSGKGKKDKLTPFAGGLWRYSRHPPYFGEMLCWWGLWTLTLSPSTGGALRGGARAAQYGAVVSPLLTMLLLLFASGIPTADKPQARRVWRRGDARAWAAYREYRARTSVLVPLPPAVYRPLPDILKRTVLLDFAMYDFDPVKEGEADQQGADAETRRDD
ncbi:DUF1295-domain-containing protein [Gloeopeniophorella convolvens]|nr:DUF1295-domain-containing protein [Gloeopeniophorella convolvens]